MISYITPAYDYKGTKIAVVQIGSDEGDTFKIMKKCINYVRGKNIESYKLLGSASVFNNLHECIDKFSNLVNGDREKSGKSPIKFRVE